LLLRLAAVYEAGDRTVELALPGDGHLGVNGERHLELVTAGAEVLTGLSRRQLGVAGRLVAHSSKTTTAPQAFGHGRFSSRHGDGGSVGVTAGTPSGIPGKGSRADGWFKCSERVNDATT